VTEVPFPFTFLGGSWDWYGNCISGETMWLQTAWW